MRFLPCDCSVPFYKTAARKTSLIPSGAGIWRITRNATPADDSLNIPAILFFNHANTAFQDNHRRGKKGEGKRKKAGVFFRKGVYSSFEILSHAAKLAREETKKNKNWQGLKIVFCPKILTIQHSTTSFNLK
jgi:hypothetical protein